jgi:surface glycoprotein (TIGR04207 family)/PGF-CTERM protein
MTDNNNSKLRAVFLAALMVLWVFAGTMAFAGSAAAVDNAEVTISNVQPAPDTPGADSEYTVTIDVSGGSAEVGSLDLDFSDAADSGSDVSQLSQNDITYSVDTNGQGNPNNVNVDGQTVRVSFGSSHTVDNQITVNLGGGSGGAKIQNPDAGVYGATATAYHSTSGQGDTQQSSVSYRIGTEDAAPTASGADATWQTGGSLRWQGQHLYFDASSSAADGLSEWQIREYDAQASTGENAVGSNVREFTLGSDEVRLISTSNLEGTYAITAYDGSERRVVKTNENGVVTGDTDNTAGDAYIEIAVQELNTSFTADSVNLGKNSTVEVDSDRTDFPLNVTSDSFTGAELAELFPEATHISGTDTAQFSGVTNSPDELTFVANRSELNFDLETGDYEFDFEVDDTTASDTANITVGEEVAGDASFSQSTYSTPRGDIVNITYSTNELDNTTLHIGGADDGYNATITVEPNDDGEVAIEMNTYLAGYRSSTAASELDAFTVTKGDYNATASSEDNLDYAPESGLYDLEVTSGDQTQDLAALRIQQRSYDGLTVHTAPANEFNRMKSKDRLLDRINDGWVTESEEIAVAPDSRSSRKGDVIVYQIEASGLEGYLETLDVDGAAALKTMLQAEGPDGTDGDGFHDSHAYFEFEVEQENPGQNERPKQLDVQETSDSAFGFVPDPDNNTYYIVAKSDQLQFERAQTPDDVYDDGGSTPGDNVAVKNSDQFNATFRVTDDYEGEFIRADTGNVTHHDEFEIVDREANFDTINGNITVQAVEDAEITGETTVAPGTELTVRVSSSEEGGATPIFETAETRVNADGTFAGMYDFSGAEDGQQFTATIASQGFEDNAETPGVFGEPTGASFDVSDLSLSSTSVEAGEDVDVSATVTNSGDVEGNQTVSVLVDGSEVDSQDVTLGANESTTVESTISTSDLSGDVTVEVASADDSASTTLTVETEATPTATPSEGTETAAPETATETASQDQPGFGAGLALIALLGAALLAARRNAF